MRPFIRNTFRKINKKLVIVVPLVEPEPMVHTETKKPFVVPIFHKKARTERE